MLKEYGAEIKYFSPLRDDKLPDACQALLIGGGYPELYAGKLSENRRMRSAVRKAVENGMPVVATCFYAGKLVRFGYIELQEKRSSFLPEGERIKGHEFHYYDSTDNGNGTIAIKQVTGKEYSCIIEDDNCWMGFPHLYYPSNLAFAKSFVEKAEKYKERCKSKHGEFVSLF